MGVILVKLSDGGQRATFVQRQYNAAFKVKYEENELLYMDGMTAASSINKIGISVFF